MLGLPYKSSVSVTIQSDSQTETKQIDVNVIFLQQLENPKP